MKVKFFWGAIKRYDQEKNHTFTVNGGKFIK